MKEVTKIRQKPTEYNKARYGELIRNRRTELGRWVDLINAEKPDLVLIGGDIIDRSLRPVTEGHYAEEFRRLEAPVWTVLGNHETYAGLPQAEQFFQFS